MLRNRTVSKEVRRLRAQALHELGGIFQDAAASHVEAAPVQDQVLSSQLDFRGSNICMKLHLGVLKNKQATSCHYTAIHQQSAYRCDEDDRLGPKKCLPVQPQAEQARQHFENAFQRIVDKRNAVDDASYGQS